MAIVAGVDFGTLNARVTLLDSAQGRLATATAEYALNRRHNDPDYATQSQADQMKALVSAMRAAVSEAAINQNEVDHHSRHDRLERHLC